MGPWSPSLFFYGFFPPYSWLLHTVWCLRAVLALYEALGVIQKCSVKMSTFLELYTETDTDDRRQQSFFFFFFRREVKHEHVSTNTYGLVPPADAVDWCNTSFGFINANPTERRLARDFYEPLRLQPRLSEGGMMQGQNGSSWKWDINVIITERLCYVTPPPWRVNARLICLPLIKDALSSAKHFKTHPILAESYPGNGTQARKVYYRGIARFHWSWPHV